MSRAFAFLSLRDPFLRARKEARKARILLAKKEECSEVAILKAIGIGRVLQSIDYLALLLEELSSRTFNNANKCARVERGRTANVAFYSFNNRARTAVQNWSVSAYTLQEEKSLYTRVILLTF